jgi:hypothetical protein
VSLVRLAKLNVVFLRRQVSRKNTSFNFEKGWFFFRIFVINNRFSGEVIGCGITVGGLPKGGIGAFKLSGKTKISWKMELS